MELLWGPEIPSTIADIQILWGFSAASASENTRMWGEGAQIHSKKCPGGDAIYKTTTVVYYIT